MMNVIGIKTPLIKPGDDLVSVLLESIREYELKDGDVLVIASSVISTVNEYLIKLSDVKARENAIKLAHESGLNEKFVEIVIQESDNILGIGKECILTLKDGTLRINAGVDSSNAPPGKILLLPKDSDKEAEKIRQYVKEKTGKKIGVIISDSHVQPLRLGTIGIAIGVAGIESVIDCRKEEDLYNRPLNITFRAVADQLASAAQLFMGESNDRIPIVLIRDVKVNQMDKSKIPTISIEDDVYSSLYKSVID